MRRFLYGVVGGIVLSTVCFSSQAFSWRLFPVKPNVSTMNCKVFLNNGLVQDQLFEIFGDSATYQVTMHRPKTGPFCTLDVTDEAGVTYYFSSKSPKNFVHQGNKLELNLYEKLSPEVKNILEATYEDRAIIDVNYDFPVMNNK